MVRLNFPAFVATIVLVAIIAVLPTNNSQKAQAYAPPPATNLFALLRMNHKIILPPHEIMMPNQLNVAGAKYNFNGTDFILSSGTPKLNISVTKAGEDRLEHYIITFTGFQRGEGGLAWFKNLFKASAQSIGVGSYTPYEFKLSFNPISKNQATSFGEWLRSNGDSNYTYLGDRRCSEGQNPTGSTICTETVATLYTPGLPLGIHRMKQGIPVFGGITVEGNVAGSGTLSGFTFDPASAQAIAVGGTVSATVTSEGGTEIENYIESATKLQWGGSTGVGQKINKLVNDNFSNGDPSVANTISDNLFLNSPTELHINQQPTTLSSPPEGKLWSKDGDLTLNSVNVNGSGTVIVRGNLTINDDLTCASNARVGFIVTGSISINLNNSGTIGCGAYTATGGSINFNGARMTDPGVNYLTKGIFVARDNIILPTIGNDITMEIKYDHNFATNPTILFGELLSITFRAISF